MAQPRGFDAAEILRISVIGHQLAPYGASRICGLARIRNLIKMGCFFQAC